jgi:hypothetical protein
MRTSNGSAWKADKCLSTMRATTIVLALSILGTVTPAGAEIIEQRIIEGYTAIVSADLLPGFGLTPTDPDSTTFSYQGDLTCTFRFSKLRTDPSILSVTLRDQVLNSFRQLQAHGFALSNPAEPQFINHGTSMWFSYATVMSDRSTLIKVAAQGPNGGRIVGTFNCPLGGPQMANAAAGALQSLNVQLKRAAGGSPYYNPNENLNRFNELGRAFNNTH